MKVSDYIVEFLIEKGVTDLFGYPGGMVTHLMDSLGKKKEYIKPIKASPNRTGFLLFYNDWCYSFYCYFFYSVIFYKVIQFFTDWTSTIEVIPA